MGWALIAIAARHNKTKISYENDFFICTTYVALNRPTHLIHDFIQLHFITETFFFCHRVLSTRWSKVKCVSSSRVVLFISANRWSRMCVCACWLLLTDQVFSSARSVDFVREFLWRLWEPELRCTFLEQWSLFDQARRSDIESSHRKTTSAGIFLLFTKCKAHPHAIKQRNLLSRR